MIQYYIVMTSGVARNFKWSRGPWRRSGGGAPEIITGLQWSLPPVAEGKVVWRQSLVARRFLQFFNENNAFYTYFGQIIYFRVIIYQLKAFETAP